MIILFIIYFYGINLVYSQVVCDDRGHLRELSAIVNGQAHHYVKFRENVTGCQTPKTKAKYFMLSLWKLHNYVSWEKSGCFEGSQYFVTKDCYKYITWAVVSIYLKANEILEIRCNGNWSTLIFVDNPTFLFLRPEYTISPFQYLYPGDVLIITTECANIPPVIKTNVYNISSLKCSLSGIILCYVLNVRNSFEIYVLDDFIFHFEIVTVFDPVVVHGRYSMRNIPFNYNPGPYFELLETITCDLMNGLNPSSLIKHNGTEKRISIRFKDFSYLNKVFMTEIYLRPEYNFTKNNKYTVECFLGNTNHIKDAFVVLSTTTIIIVSSEVSDIILEDPSGKIIEAQRRKEILDIFGGVVINCGKLFLTAIVCDPCLYPPLSKMISFTNVPGNPNLLYTSINKGIIQESWTFKYIYAQCGQLTPLILVVNKPSDFGFKFIWPTSVPIYFLRGSVFVCYGKNVLSVDVECVGCKPEEKLHIYSLNTSFIKVQVPHNYLKDSIVLYRCSALMNNGYKYHKYLTLTILIQYSLSIEENNKIIIPGGPISCKAEVTINFNGTPIQDSFSWPIMIRVNGKPYISYDNVNILPLFQTNISTLFEYCCLYITNGAVIGMEDILKYVTCSNFLPLPVVWNYELRYSVPLDKIYPGTILRCYFCVNFTSHPFLDSPCNSTNQIQSLLDYNETRIDGQTVLIMKHNVEFIEIPPNFPLNENSEYIEQTNLNVQINCLINEFQRSENIRIFVKDCVLDPPVIRVMPNFKSLLMVGDKVSCDTTLEVCKGKVKYSISVETYKSSNQELENVSSIVLKAIHMSRKTQVICTAGVLTLRNAERSFRVEGPPQNISIKSYSLKEIPGRLLFTMGDYLECRCDALPKADYEWTLVDGPSFLQFSLKHLIITDFMYSGYYTVKCEASNPHGMVQKTISFYVFNNHLIWYENENIWLIIFLWFCTLIFLLVEINVATFIIYETIAFVMLLNLFKRKVKTPIESQFDKFQEISKQSISTKRLNSITIDVSNKGLSK